MYSVEQMECAERVTDLTDLSLQKYGDSPWTAHGQLSSSPMVRPRDEKFLAAVLWVWASRL